MKKLTILFLVGYLLTSMCGCGASAPSAGPSPDGTKETEEAKETKETEETKEPGQIPIELTEEEYVFHGVHMRIPDVYEMELTGENGEEATSRWKDPATSEYQKGGFDFRYNEETYWDVSLLGEDGPYSDASSRIYYSKENYDGRIGDFITCDRRRINNIDVLIERFEIDHDPNHRAIRVTLVLKSGVVEIYFNSSSEQFDELFERCIESVWVEDEEVPAIVKTTSTEELTKAGLSTKAWQYQGLYMHVPASYTLVEDEGNMIWFSEDAESFILLRKGNMNLLSMDETQVEDMLKDLFDDFEEMTYFQSTNYNGMYISSAGAKGLLNGNELTVDWSVFAHVMPAVMQAGEATDEDFTTVIIYWPTEDTEAEKLLSDAWYTIHYADGWVGDGLLEVEPLTLSEFDAQIGE